MTTAEELDTINDLVSAGILGREEMPTPQYWHWPVNDPEKLPDWLKENYELFGEVRHYW